MSKTFPQKIDKNVDLSFPATLFVLSRFRVFLSDRSSKTLQTTFCKYNRVEKLLQKNRQKKRNRFFSVLFYHVFGHFSVRGVQKYHTQISKNKSDPGPFLASDPPTHHGPPIFSGAAPPLAAAIVHSP
jgi:hypothetical protein